ERRAGVGRRGRGDREGPGAAGGRSALRQDHLTDARRWHPARMEPELAIRMRGVVKRYGQITGVAGLDLEVPLGTCVGLLGPNGAGKSTTMRLLTAQSIADHGGVRELGLRAPAQT